MKSQENRAVKIYKYLPYDDEEVVVFSIYLVI